MNTPMSDHLSAAEHPELVRTPATRFISILGDGAPGTDEFYRKKALIGDIARQLNAADTTPVIEIQYWYPDDAQPVEIADFYSVNPIPTLQYRVMARIDHDAAADEIDAARTTAASTAGHRDDRVEGFLIPEQLVVQVLHTGPFAEEYTTLVRLGQFATNVGAIRNGAHHEIHLDGFTRETPQSTLRTILRDPVTLNRAASETSADNG